MERLTVSEFAERVGLSHDTVTRLIKAGDVKGMKKNPFAVTSPFLIPESEVKRYLDEQKKRTTLDVA